MIYASQPTQVRPGKGGGGIKGGKNGSGSLLGNFWVLVGEGERFWATTGNSLINGINAPQPGSGKLTLKQILFNGDVWWDADATDGTNAERANQFTFYPGNIDEDIIDPTMAADLGIENVPPYPGLAHITFTQVDLNSDPNTGNYPIVSVIVEADLPSTSQSIIPDLLIRCGINSGRPVIPSAQAVVDPLIHTGAAETGTGNAIPQSGNTLQELLSQTLVLADAIQYNYPDQEATALIRRPTLRYSPNQPAAFYTQTVGVNELNIGEDPTPLVNLDKEGEEELTTVLDLRYAGPDQDFEPQSVRVHTVQAGLGKTDSLEFRAAFPDANTVAQVGYRIIAEASVAQYKYRYTGFVPSLGHTSIVQASSNLLTPHLTRDYVLRPLELERSPNGSIQVEAVEFNGVSNVAFSSTLPTKRATIAQPLNQDRCAPVYWFEGPRQILSQPLTKRSIHLILPRQDGPFTTTPPLYSVLYSVDGGTTSNLLAAGLTSNADEGTYTLSDVPVPSETAFEIDYNITLDVTVNERVVLTSSTEQTVLAGTANTAYISGFGFIRYVNADLTGPGTYRLTGLIWNSLDLQQLSLHLPRGLTGQIFFLGTPHTVDVPNDATLGGGLILTSSTEGVNCGSHIYAPTSWRGLGTFLRPCRDLTHAYNNSGGLVFSWGPGTSQTELGDSTFLGVNADPAASGDYRVIIYDQFDNEVRAETVGATTYTYSLANQVLDGLSGQPIYFRVAAIDINGQSLDPEFLWRYSVETGTVEEFL